MIRNSPSTRVLIQLHLFPVKKNNKKTKLIRAYIHIILCIHVKVLSVFLLKFMKLEAIIVFFSVMAKVLGGVLE